MLSKKAYIQNIFQTTILFVGSKQRLQTTIFYQIISFFVIPY